MKAIYLILLCAACAFQGLQAQTIEDKCLDNFKKYCDNMQKHPEKASEYIKDASYWANKSYKIDSKMKVVIWYIYLGDLVKNNPKSREIGEFSGRIVGWGAKLDKPLDSYGIALITANAAFSRAEYVKPQWKPVYLIKSLLLLQKLEGEKVQPIAEEEYAPFYILADLNISETERQNMIRYLGGSVESINGKEWYDAANAAYEELESDGNLMAAHVALNMAEKQEYPDAWALHGKMLEEGKAMEKDVIQATEFYQKAAEAGSKWGKVNYSRLLIGGKVIQQDYAKAFSLLASIENDKEFGSMGGSYELARLYENGWGVDKDSEKAMVLYMDSHEKAKQSSTRKRAYEAANRIENRMVEELIDREVAEMNIQNMNEQELNTLAQRYEAVKADEKTFKYYSMAADKGNSYSACKLGLKYYNKKGRTEADLEKAAKMFMKGAEGNYAPCKYNIAAFLLYGYGLSPDHDKAKLYFKRYLDQIEAEGYDEYYKDDYVGTITGTLYREEATKRGIPLQKVIQNFDSPEELYTWARYRERDSRKEIPLYFYQRAAAKGHTKAAERLATLRKEQQTVKGMANSK